MRDTMLLAEQRDQLIQTDVVQRQAAAIFTACRQKLLSIPHTLARRLVGKDHKTIHDALTKEIHKALREMANFHEKVVNPDWELDDSDGVVPALIDPPENRQSLEQSKSKSQRRRSRGHSS